MQQPIKILIVDDHASLRKAMESTLSMYKELRVVGSCEDGIYVEAFIEENEVDVILMDIEMKHKGGIETTKDVKSRFNEVKIIAYSSHEEEFLKKLMLDSGASAYLVKGENPEEIRNTIIKVCEN